MAEEKIRNLEGWFKNLNQECGTEMQAGNYKERKYMKRRIERPSICPKSQKTKINRIEKKQYSKKQWLRTDERYKSRDVGSTANTKLDKEKEIHT